MAEEDKKKEKNQSQTEMLKEDIHSLCPIHRIPFPRGASCPKCMMERSSKS